MAGLTEMVRAIAQLKADLAAHETQANLRADAIRAEIASLSRSVALSDAMLDADKIGLARTIVEVRGAYARAGTDRASVIEDAIAFFATGPTPRRDLRREYFGTKNYDAWSGQRADHAYGYGPRHGSICFSVGMTADARKRADLTPEEIEACIYLLTRIDAVQKAEAFKQEATK